MPIYIKITVYPATMALRSSRLWLAQHCSFIRLRCKCNQRFCASATPAFLPTGMPVGGKRRLKAGRAVSLQGPPALKGEAASGFFAGATPALL